MALAIQYYLVTPAQRSLFSSPHTDTNAVVMEIDHDRRVVYSETLALVAHDREGLLASVQPTEEQVMGRLTAPVVTTQLDIRNIAFERCVQQGS